MTPTLSVAATAAPGTYALVVTATGAGPAARSACGLTVTSGLPPLTVTGAGGAPLRDELPREPRQVLVEQLTERRIPASG
jgi:hypothetical protein